MQPIRRIALSIAFLVGGVLIAQQPAIPNVPISLPGIGSINPATLSVSLNFPLIGKVGRGVPISWAMTYNGSFWDNTLGQWQAPTLFGWSLNQGGSDTDNLTYTATNGASCGFLPTDPHTRGYTQTYSARRWIDSYGIAHQFSGTATFNECTTDMSAWTPALAQSDGYSIDANNVVYDSGGIPVNGITIQDTNGNQLRGGTDTLGTNFPTSGTGFYAPGSQPDMHFQYPDTTGTLQDIHVVFGSYSVRTNFGFSYVTEWTSPTPMQLVQKIIYPDREYDFTYEPTPGYPSSTTGRIHTITLPEGGVVTFNYTGTNDSNDQDGLLNRLEVLTSDSTSPTVYTLSEPTPGSDTLNTSITRPSGLTNSYAFARVRTAHPSTSLSNLFVPISSTVAGETSSFCYDGTSYTCATTSLTNPILKVTAISGRDGVTKKRVDTYSAAGEITQSDEYDYTTGSTYTLLRSTIKTYNASLGTIQNRQASSQVVDGAGHQLSYEQDSYDEFALVDDPSVPTAGLPGYVAWSGNRGNLTTRSTWVSTTGTYLQEHYHYDNAGVLQYVILPGTAAQITYKHDSTDGFVTETDFPTVGSVSLVTKSTYDVATGLSTSDTDANSHKTLYSYDSGLRATSIVRDTTTGGDGGSTTYSYPDTRTTVVNSTIQVGSSVITEARQMRDTYGRTIRTTTTNGQSTSPYYLVDRCYDLNGRVSFVSKRYQGILTSPQMCSGSGDTNTYDTYSRVMSVQHSDGSHRDFVYFGRSVKSTDEGNGTKHRTLVSESDGVGRIKSICEYVNANFAVGTSAVAACALDINTLGGDTGKLAMLTTYTYGSTSTSSTVQINNAGQSRSWATDSLGRVVTESVPERSAATTYTYTVGSTGYTTTRTRPRANQTSPTVTTTTTSSMDLLGRMTSLAYLNSDSSTPDASISAAYDTAPSVAGLPTFDNKFGRLVSLSRAGVNQYVSYNSNGAVEWKGDCVPSTCSGGSPRELIQQYDYDLLGRIYQWTDGVTGWDHIGYSVASEITSVSNDTAGTIIGAATYGPDGPLSVTYDTRTAKVLHDTRGRTTSVGLYNPSNTLLYGYGISWAPNGQVNASCDTASGTFSDSCAPSGSVPTPVRWNYTYDELNRLTDAAMSNGTSERSYVYDGWGNRWQENIVAGGGASLPVLGFNSNNQITSTYHYSYDAVGNVIGDSSGASYTYDAEGRLLTAVAGGTTTTYTYGPDGQRSTSTMSGVVSGYVYDLGGKPTSIWNGTGALTASPRYMGDNKLGSIKSAGGFSYDFETLQGTSGYSDTMGGVFHALPFGEDITSGLPSNTYQFAGMDWNPKTATAHASNREYSPPVGRWMSPDPYSGSYDPLDPQSFNRYTYAQNSPMTNVDPLGLEVYDIGNDSGSEAFSYYAGDHDPISGQEIDHDDHCQDDVDVCTGVNKALQWLASHLTSALLSFVSNSQNAPGPDTSDLVKNDALRQIGLQGGTVPVIVGQRATKNIWTKIFSLGLAKHSYFIVEGDMVQVLGNPGSSHNQQVRINDPTRAQRGKEHTMYVSQAQADALVSGSEYFAQHTGSGLNQSDYAHPCPTCSGGQEGYNFLLHNSNSFVYNMLSTDPAGSIPPGAGPAITPGWAKKPDDWYPNP